MVVGLLDIGACVGSAVLIGFGVGDASEIGENIGCDMGASVIGSGDGVVVRGAAVCSGVEGASSIGTGVGGTPIMGGDNSEELLAAGW